MAPPGHGDGGRMCGALRAVPFTATAGRHGSPRGRTAALGLNGLQQLARKPGMWTLPCKRVSEKDFENLLCHFEVSR